MCHNTNNYSFPYIFIGIVTLIFLGCADQGSNKTDKEKIIPSNIRKLNDLTVYSETGKVDTVLLKKVRSYNKHYSIPGPNTPPLSVDDLNRVFIRNRQKHAIDVYDGKGNFVTRFGRKGRGPGEFHRISRLQILDDHLYVYDRKLQQFQVFSLQSLSYAKKSEPFP